MPTNVALFILMSLLLFSAGPSSAQTPVKPAATAPESAAAPTQQEVNKALATRFYNEVWFSRNPDVVDEIIAPNYTIHDIGDNKGLTEPAAMQKEIAEMFWNNGNMSGTIDFQIAEGDLVATRWQWDFEPTSWWMKALGGRRPLPIINVFRFDDGKVVEIWNHRHDIDFAWGRILFAQGLLVGLIPSLILGIISLILWRKLRKARSIPDRSTS